MPRDRLQQRFAEEVARAPLYAPLGVWMQEHHAELQRMLRGKRPNWDEFAQHFAEAGLRDHTSRKPTAETTKATWALVVQEMARKRRSRPR